MFSNSYFPSLLVTAIFTSEESFARNNDTDADCKGFCDSSVMRPAIFAFFVWEKVMTENNIPVKSVNKFLIVGYTLVLSFRGHKIAEIKFDYEMNYDKIQTHSVKGQIIITYT